MESVLRAAALYAFLLVLFRITGRRALSEITTFDFVLLLVIGEATQQALLGDDFSVINAFVVIATLVLIDILLSLFKERSPRVGRFLDGVPLIVVEYGKPLRGAGKEWPDLGDPRAGREVSGRESRKGRMSLPFALAWIRPGYCWPPPPLF